MLHVFYTFVWQKNWCHAQANKLNGELINRNNIVNVLEGEKNKNKYTFYRLRQMVPNHFTTRKVAVNQKH